MSLALLAHCSESNSGENAEGTGGAMGADSGANGSGGSAGSGGNMVDSGAGGSDDRDAAQRGDSEPSSITASGVVVELSATSAADGGAGPLRLEGVSVCVLDDDMAPCATTDENGRFTISGLPPQSDVGLLVTDPEHLNVLASFSTENEDVSGLSVLMATDALATQLLELIGGTYPSPTTGAVSFNVLDEMGDPLEGVSATLAPSSGIGPVYLTSGGIPDDSLTETPAGSRGGFFANVEPGDYEITVDHATASTCTVESGWATNDSGRVALRVVANHLTTIQVTCE